MRCPFFNHTLVLLIDHGDDGSFGFVVNRKTDLEITDVFDEVGVTPARLPTRCRRPCCSAARCPRSPGGSSTTPKGFPSRRRARPSPSATASRAARRIELLERIARGDGPETCAMMLGYSGWGAGQLESEMKQGSWIPVDLDYSLVFETPIDLRWEAALATLGIDPARVIDNQIASA